MSIEKQCVVCNKTVFFKPSRIGRKYCSFECYNSKRNMDSIKKEKTCQKCGKKYFVYPSQLRRFKSTFCSAACMQRDKKEKFNTPEARSYRRLMKGTKMRTVDDLFSKIVRKRDGKCMKCGKTENLHCSHVLPRTYISVRWNLDNAIALCLHCHIYWWHKYPHEAVHWFDETFPNRYEKVLDIAMQHNKVKRDAEYERLKDVAKALNIKL